MKKRLNTRDVVGFVLFVFVILAMVYGVNRGANNTFFICITVVSVVICVFWLSPKIEELLIIYKNKTVKVKQRK